MKTILFSLLLLLAANVDGQTDTCMNLFDAELSMNSDLFKRLLKREFTKIYSPDTKNGIGNYASIEPVGTTVNFSGNIILKSDIISIKANGGVSDGIVSLFSNNKWSNNIGLDVQYNLFLTNNWNYVSLDAMEYLNYTRALTEGKCTELAYDFVDDRTESCYKANLLENELIILKSEIQKHAKSRNDFKSKLIKDHQDSVSLAESELAYLKDSVTLHVKQQEIIRLRCECDGLCMLSKNMIDSIEVYVSRKAKKKWNREQLDNLDVLGFRINWFSFGYGVSNNSFRLYDPTQPFDSQFSLNSFLTQEVRFQFNRYAKHKNGNTYYVSLWLKGSIADNFESLTQNDFEEINSDTSSNTVRKNIKKFSAYSGDYKKDLYSLTFGSDFYYFIKGNVLAFHIFPKHTSFQNLQPETSLGVGILMPFRKAGDDKSIVNAELFMNTPNLFKTNGVTESNYFKRSEYGIRLTAPISFN